MSDDTLNLYFINLKPVYIESLLCAPCCVNCFIGSILLEPHDLVDVMEVDFSRICCIQFGACVMGLGGNIEGVRFRGGPRGPERESKFP